MTIRISEFLLEQERVMEKLKNEFSISYVSVRYTEFFYVNTNELNEFLFSTKISGSKIQVKKGKKRNRIKVEFIFTAEDVSDAQVKRMVFRAQKLLKTNITYESNNGKVVLAYLKNPAQLRTY